jgi:hypothetical protein
MFTDHEHSVQRCEFYEDAVHLSNTFLVQSDMT